MSVRDGDGKMVLGGEDCRKCQPVVRVNRSRIDRGRLPATKAHGQKGPDCGYSLNRLTGLVDFANASFGFSYDAPGRRTSLTRQNGVTSIYSYDAPSRLIALLH